MNATAAVAANLGLDVNGLYVILFNQDGLQNEWHWGLYLHRAGGEGWLFHIITPGGDWTYQHRATDRVMTSQRVVAALKVAVITEDMHDGIHTRIGAVPLKDTARYGALTCRTWILRVLDELDSEGYVSLRPGITFRDIEMEAEGLAQQAPVVGNGPLVRNSCHSRR